MQKHVNLVDLVKSFPTNIYLQNLASIQKRTSPVKFAQRLKNQGKVRYRTFRLSLVLRVSLVNGGLVVGERLLLLHDELREVLRDGLEVRNCGLVLLLLRVRRRELLVTPKDTSE